MADDDDNDATTNNTDAYEDIFIAEVIRRVSGSNKVAALTICSDKLRRWRDCVHREDDNDTPRRGGCENECVAEAREAARCFTFHAESGAGERSLEEALRETRDALVWVNSDECDAIRSLRDVAVESLREDAVGHVLGCTEEAVPWSACERGEGISHDECVRASRQLGGCVAARISNDRRGETTTTTRARGMWDHFWFI
jgi:hypothetical protein